MERKTKHRILGIFVVIGIIIILLPFFQGSNEVNTSVGMVKPPAFPDQSVQMPTPVQTAAEPVTTQQNNTATVAPQPDDTINPKKITINEVDTPEMTKQAPVELPKPLADIKSDEPTQAS